MFVVPQIEVVLARVVGSLAYGFLIVSFSAVIKDFRSERYIVLCADTGCRRGELCGLQWQDIDFEKEAVTINRTLNYTVDAGVYTGLPKNGEIRSIDIG